MQLQYYGESNMGLVRKNNEDAWGMIPELNLFICCDGMGGHAAGEIASSMTVEEVKRVMEDNQDMILAFIENGERSGHSKHDLAKLMEQAVQSACIKVYQEAQLDDAKRGMGTTCDVLLLTPETGFIAHVGDSRVYLERQGKIHQLTEDHSLMNELLRRGKYTQEEFEKTPFFEHRNALTRAVGVYESIEVELFDFSVLPGDAFLMCSDGMSHYLTPFNMSQALQHENPEDIVKEFIEVSRAGGGHDNITGILVKIPIAEDAAESAIARAAEINLSLEVLHHIPLFQHLDYRELVRIHNLTAVRSYTQDELIVKEGEEGREFFVILRGKIRLEKEGTEIAMLQDRDHFGEMALVDKSPRSASAYAAVPTRVLVIQRRDFYNIVRYEHAIAVKLLWSFVQELTKRLRMTTKELSTALDAEEVSDLIEEVPHDDEED
ncbi:cyclic nucleotide-binding domain-containing protein [Myxococcota bacterium]|nr:cyclic nucleotide-binding domain-containing protein [Myxococcota bacterium]